MSLITVTPTSVEQYATDLESLKAALPRPLHFLQAAFYGAWQEKSGKQVLYFAIHEADQLIGCGMAIKYPLPAGYSYWYCPYGPLLTNWSDDVVTSLKQFFKDQKAGKLIFARFDAEKMPKTGFTEPSNAASATASLQPRREWVLDISPDEETIYNAFHKTARYQMRLAERSNTTIRFEQFTPEQLDKFYDLLIKTSERNSFGIMPKSYYQAVFEQLATTPGSFLGFADVDGKPAAAVLMASFDQQIHYIFGCSSNEFRKIAPSYLLLWTSIQRAKAQGDTLFNFGGITDSIKSTHLDGVTEFKKRFGGFTVEHDKPADLVLNSFLYKAFAAYKKLQHR